jgi:glycosyltransferase involved in cell wall biosynthesis
MKIALVHDYLKEYGGAELVLETLSDIFPQAQIFTTLYCPQFFGPHRPRLEAKWSHRIHQSFFAYLPLASKLISPLRLLSPLAFRLMNFKNFDLIITSATGAYFPNALNKNQARLFCYCHTPPRYLYGLPTARHFSRHSPITFLANLFNRFLRRLDCRFAQNVDQFIANSRTVAARIKKFYHRSALVIYPPVDISATIHELSSINRKPYYLTGGRLAWAKRYDIALRACQHLNLPLKIFGRDFAHLESQLKKIAILSAPSSAKAKPTLEFLGEITQEEKIKLYSQAKAFIFCSDNEDFGIVSVEAMAAGCPVIAYRSGGITETVLDGKTGVLFDHLTPESCAAAIQKLNILQINPKDCLANAQKFSRGVFVKKIKTLVSTYLPHVSLSL